MKRYGHWVKWGGLACVAGLLAALWCGLILAEFNRFAAWPALCAAVIAGAAVWRHFSRLSLEQTAHEGRPRWLWAVAALAMLSLTVTLPPSEFILGGWDPGVYVHTAAVLARDGELLQIAPDLAALDAESRTLIGRQGQNAWEPFLGMRMLPDGRISPQFYHLYPVLMALLWACGGVRAALLVNPLLNVISIVVMYLWACRWVRPRWAFVAALLLALNPAQVWQAGFATAELLAQCLLLIGLVMTGRALSEKTGKPMDALLAGAAIGLMMLAKYEAILFVVPFSLVLLAGLRDRSQRRQLSILLGTLAVLGVHAGVHQIFFSPLYHPMGNWVVPGLAAAGVAALLIGVAALLFPRRLAADISGERGGMLWLRLTVLAGFAAWVFFAWYIRPHLTVDGRVLALFTRLVPGANEAHWFAFLAGRNARNFWYLKSLFGTAGLLAALAGVGVLLVRTRTIWRTAWLAASLGMLVALMTQVSHEPFMMFVARRMVPVILPLLCLGGAALCDRCEWVLRKHPRAGVLAGVLVLAVSLAGTFGGTLYLATQREWPGLVNWYDQLADRIPREALVYSDQPGFAAPLRFMYGIPAYEVRAMAPGQRTDPLPMMMNAAQQHAVFWLTQSAIPEAYTAYAEPTVTQPLRSVILGTTPHTLPRYIRARGGDFTLYRIVPQGDFPDAPTW